ncbi:MAG: hypothetical protein GX346_08240 [Clostridiales bacterium]|nr:hypothetical protein [Clostridiales bacterium]
MIIINLCPTARRRQPPYDGQLYHETKFHDIIIINDYYKPMPNGSSPTTAF